MAAAQLDKNWDAWVARLSESYAQSLDLLEQGKTEEAVYAYRAGFVQTVKQLFSEAADVYPLRFDGATCWSAWTRQLYRLSVQAEAAFKAGKHTEAAAMLPQLRRHFHELHQQCNMQRSNDALFVFVEAMNQEALSGSALSEVVEALLGAEPSRKAAAEAQAYQEARDQWLAQVRPLLEKPSLTGDDAARLREITLPFYKTYGLPFE